MPCNFHLRALGGQGQGGDPRGRRHADGVQHDRDLGRDHDGHRGDEGVAGQPRGDRRLDRARRLRPRVRRGDRDQRLRQDDPGDGDGAVPAERPERDALRRLDLPGPLQGSADHDPGGVRGDRRPRRRPDHGRRADRDRGRRLARRGRLRRTVHREHDGDGVRGARDLAGGYSGVPATDPHKVDVAKEAGRLVMDVLRRGQRPSDIITRDGLENAIAAIACSGGSTNGVLHLLAVANEIGRRAVDRRLRPDQRAHPAAVRPEAERPVRRPRPVRRRRGPARPQAAEGGRDPPRDSPDRDRQDRRPARRRGARRPRASRSSGR